MVWPEPPHLGDVVLKVIAEVIFHEPIMLRRVAETGKAAHSVLLARAESRNRETGHLDYVWHDVLSPNEKEISHGRVSWQTH
jgi:hypothetical protein